MKFVFVLVIVLSLGVFISATISPGDKNRNQNQQKVKQKKVGPIIDNVFERKLIDEEPSPESIRVENAYYARKR